MSLLSDLNLQQREAVMHETGPVLVLAGAGSGKTRVITYRIAHLMKEKELPPYNILAVTFTNKAAAEMKDRVKELLGDSALEMPTICTFHSFCLQTLRRHAHLIGFPNAFTIYDVDDQLAVIRKIIKDKDYEGITPRAIQSRISFAKNSKHDPEEIFNREIDQDILAIYQEYQNALKRAGAMDFDDLLIHTNTLFREQIELLQRYQQRFQQILVDEYQDTNFAQYSLIKLLSRPRNNICVVGDDDQSIYRWRGADITNILNFSKDFEGTRVIKLEQNYRSTQNILDAAHGIVENLLGRHPKKLWTDNGRGEPITYFQGDEDSSESSFVVRNLNQLLRDRSPSDFAILYRTNSQSRSLEEALSRHKIPYQVIGGTRFYERREIKDSLAYLKFALNPEDEVSLRRIINTPTRGIGDVTIGKIELAARKNEMSMWQLMTESINFLDVTPNIKRSLNKFINIIKSIMDHIDSGAAISEILDFTLKESEYINALIKEGTDESIGRIDNLRELLSSIKSYELNNADEGLEDYMDQVALIADVDNYEADAERVVMMTLHSAKGLEFPTVFLVGMEDGLLPHSRNIQEPDLLEEERRLAYVGMTRAKEKLFLTGARSRRTYEGLKLSRPSRFLDDIPVGVLEERGSDRLTTKKRVTNVGANLDNIGKFFKDKKIDINLDKLQKTDSASSAQFKKGDEVFLQKYGPGRVMALEGEGDNLKYVVYFPKIGQRKKLLARIAKLTPYN